MKLKQIKIINFGQLSNLTFDLPSTQLNVFYGANEAGKSTTVAFIKQILFGFNKKNKQSLFFEDYKPMNNAFPMGGALTIEANDGSIFELERLWSQGDKAQGVLTVKKEGTIVPEKLFFDQIKDVDGSFYTDGFIFNQEMLTKIASITENDLLERIYYLGAANSNQLLNLRDQFDKAAEKMFKPAGRVPIVNKVLNELQQKRKTLNDDEFAFEEYQQIQLDLREKRQQVDKIQTSLSTVQTQLQDLLNLQKELASYQNLEKLEKQLHPVVFNQKNYQEVQNLLAQIKNLKDTLAVLQKQADSFTSENNFNDELAREFVQKRATILQWQSEYKVNIQKAEQLKVAQNQLLSLNPELKTLRNLDEQQLRQLRTDYAKLTKEETPIKPVSTLNNTYFIIGIILLVISVFLLTKSPIISLVGIIVSIGLLIFDRHKKKIIKNTEQVYQQKVTQAKQQFTNFVDQYGFDPNMVDLNNLLNQLGQYRVTAKNQETNQTNIAEIEQNIQILATKLQESFNQPVKADFIELLKYLDKIDNQLQQRRQLTEEKASINLRLKEQKQNLKELNLRLANIFAQDGITDLQDYQKRYEDSLEQAKVQTQVKALKSNLGSSLTKLKTLNDSNELKSKILQVEEKKNELTSQLNAAQTQAAEVKIKLQNLADSTAVAAAKQEVANTETELTVYSQEYLANLFAAKLISLTLDIASNERFPKMLKAATEYLSILTGDHYIGIKFNKKLLVVRKDSKKVEVKYLSRGTAEQLYFALKLAFVEQIADKINLPVLIDDSFVNFDDQRIGYIKKLLERIAQNNQVLIFTAQKSLVDRLQIKSLTF